MRVVTLAADQRRYAFNELKRICEIIADIRNRYPTDGFFSDFEETYSISASKKKAYQAYGKVLNKLDEQSWKVLKEKALN